MLDADAVINNSSQKVGGSNAYPDPAAKKWVGSDPEKHIGSTPLAVHTAGNLFVRLCIYEFIYLSAYLLFTYLFIFIYCARWRFSSLRS